MFLLNYKIVVFFYPRTYAANSQEEIPYQPILWRILTSIIDKNKRFRIETGKLIPNQGLVLNYGKTCKPIFNFIFDSKISFRQTKSFSIL